MLISTSDSHQKNLFYTDFMMQLDSQDSLLQLGRRIPWQEFEQAFRHHYHPTQGRPAKPIRVMTGLLILKYLENMSDEQVVLQTKRSPYYQAFCGFTEFQQKQPCDASELVHFRKRIGTEGIEKIFSVSVKLHGKHAEEKEVLVDTTVQEKFITYPTDGKLAIKIINRLNKLARKEGIQQRCTFTKEVKSLRQNLRHFRHVKKRAKAKKAVKRLRTIANALIRELERKLSKTQLMDYADSFFFYRQVLSQQKNDKNKIYSLHEPDVCCIAKGKDHKPYEYGSKVSIVSTKTQGVIIGVENHLGNPNDSKTLESALDAARKNRDKAIVCAICDRGYRGNKKIGETEIRLPGKPLKRDTAYQRQKKRRQCRRRAAIESCIGHLKSDHRLSRNRLKGVMGDIINLHMAASAWNFRLWIRNAILLSWLQNKLALFLNLLPIASKSNANQEYCID